MTPPEIAKLRNRFIEERRKLLSSRVDTMQVRLLSAIMEKIIEKLESSKGSLTPSLKNISLAATIDQVYDEFSSDNPAVMQLKKDFQELHKFNLKYFSAVAGGTAAREAKNSVRAIINRNIGLTDSGRIRKGGYLDRIATDEVLRQEIKDVVFSSITSNQSYASARKALQETIVGNEAYGGGLQRHYRTLVYDTYQQVDRQNQVLFANRLNLSAFIYGGTIVKDSRDFCKRRVGKVFLIEEAKEWSNLSWQGKNRNYNPLISLGGYNCLHHMDFIGNKTAMKMRPELKEVNGKLVA